MSIVFPNFFEKCVKMKKASYLLIHPDDSVCVVLRDLPASERIFINNKKITGDSQTYWCSGQNRTIRINGKSFIIYFIQLISLVRGSIMSVTISISLILHNL